MFVQCLAFKKINLNNNLSEKAFNQLFLQIEGKKLIDSLNMIDSDSKSKIAKMHSYH